MGKHTECLFCYFIDTQADVALFECVMLHKGDT